MKNLNKKLNIMFLLCAGFSISNYVSVFILHKLAIPQSPHGETLRMFGLIFFVLSVATGIALPIIFRTQLHGKLMRNKKIELKEYISYNRALFILAASSSVFSSVNYFLAVPDLYLYGSVLATLWGIYGVIPAKKRIISETKYYRVQDVR